MENIKNTVPPPDDVPSPSRHIRSPPEQSSPSINLGATRRKTSMDKASPLLNLGVTRHCTFTDSVKQSSPSPNFGPRKNSTVSEQSVIENACSPSIVPNLPKNIKENEMAIKGDPRRFTFPRTEAEEIHENKRTSQDISIILNQFKQELITYVGKRIDILQYEIVLQNKLSKKT